MKTLRLTLPLPPGVNNQYVSAGRRRVLSKGAKAFKRAGTSAIRDVLISNPAAEAFAETLQGSPFACDLVFFFETPFKRDLDGGLKIALDVLCESLGINDRHAVSLTLEKRIDPLHPRLEIELAPLPDWQFDEEYVVLSPPRPRTGEGAGG